MRLFFAIPGSLSLMQAQEIIPPITEKNIGSKYHYENFINGIITIRDIGYFFGFNLILMSLSLYIFNKHLNTLNKEDFKLLNEVKNNAEEIYHRFILNNN